MPKAIFCSFDVNVALSRYIMATLSRVDFPCPESKDSRRMCLHIQNIDMLTNQTAKQFYVL